MKKVMLVFSVVCILFVVLLLTGCIPGLQKPTTAAMLPFGIPFLFGMAEIKSLPKIAEKWTRVTPMRSEDYKLGIESPKRDWATSAVAAKENHKAAMTAAAANDSFAKGVTKAGSSKWKDKALTKGPGRFAEGVMTAGDDYSKGFQPYADVIAKTTLPPRFPKGDPRNVDRVRVISTALRAAKTGK